MPNGVEWAVIAIALMRMGAVLVPLSTLLRPPELEAQLADRRRSTISCSSESSAGATTPPISSRSAHFPRLRSRDHA